MSVNNTPCCTCDAASPADQAKCQTCRSKVPTPLLLRQPANTKTSSPLPSISSSVLLEAISKGQSQEIKDMALAAMHSPREEESVLHSPLVLQHAGPDGKTPSIIVSGAEGQLPTMDWSTWTAGRWGAEFCMENKLNVILVKKVQRKKKRPLCQAKCEEIKRLQVRFVEAFCDTFALKDWYKRDKERREARHAKKREKALEEEKERKSEQEGREGA